MKPLTYNRLLEILAGFLRSPAAVAAMAAGGFTPISRIAGEVETLIHRGMSAHSNLAPRVNRATTLSALLYRDLPKLNAASLAKRLHNIRLYLDDVLIYAGKTFRNGFPGGKLDTVVKHDRIDYRILGDERVDFNFWDNISRGLATDYRSVKYMFANNHLLAQTLRKPETYLEELIGLIEATGTVLPSQRTIIASLETGSDNMTKIDDATFVLSNIDVTLMLNGYPFTLQGISPRVSLDSKVWINPQALGGADVVQQQVFLTLQDRVEKDLVPIINTVIDAGLTAPNQARVIEEMIPILFQQFVVKPSDTAAVGAPVLKKYEDEFFRLAMEHWDVYATAHGIKAAYPHLDDAVEAGLRAHARAHFGSGTFFKETTEIQFFDWGT